MLVSAALVLWVGRGTVFKADDWDLLLYRQGFNWEVFLHPHNEHLVALQILALKGIGVLGGLDHSAYRLALVSVDLAVAFLFFLFARSRVGDWPALLVTAPLLFLGSASDSLIWSTMLGVMASLACGIGALMLLERDGLPAKAGVCVLLLAAVGFESNGLFFLVAIAIWLVLDRRWRDLWIPAIPMLAYYAWYSSYGDSHFTSGNLDHTPAFVVKMAAAGVGALSGVPYWIKHPSGVAEHAVLAIVGLVLVALMVGAAAFLWRNRPRIGGRTVAIASLPVFYWLLVALGRADGGDPYASRYAYASVLFILMLLVELARDADLAKLSRGWLGAALLAVLGVSIAANAHVLVRAGDLERSVSDHVRARTWAIELSRRTIDQNLYLEPLETVANMRAGWYLNVVDRFGESPVAGTEMADLEPLARSEADQQLALGVNAGLYPVGGARPVGTCRSVPAHRQVEVRLPRDGLLVLPVPGSTATVSLRRFAPTYKFEPTFRADAPSLLKASPDLNPRPWRVRVRTTGRTQLCGTRISHRRLFGPPLPPAGNQHCEDFNAGTRECRFRRYFPRPGPERP